MSEPKRPIHTSGVDRSPERIRDPSAGLNRMKRALKQILKVPKSAAMKRRKDEDMKGRTR